MQGEFLCHACMNAIPAGKYQFLKNAVVEWHRKIIMQFFKQYRSHRVLPALLWFVFFMVVANLISGPFFMFYVTIAYMPIIIVLFQLFFLAFKLLSIRIGVRLLFKKMLESPLTEEKFPEFPKIDKNYIRTFKWYEFLNASDPLEYFLHSEQMDSEKKYKK